MSNKQTRFTIAIEGNFGSSKQWLIDYLMKSYSFIEAVPEPLFGYEMWYDKENESPKCVKLNSYQNDPARWSYAFHHRCQLQFVKMHETRCRKPIRLLAGSLHSFQDVVIKTAHQLHHLSTAEYEILKEWSKYLNNQPAMHVDLYIYLRSTVENCLRSIHSQYESFYDDNKSAFLLTACKADLNEEARVLNILNHHYEDWLSKQSCSLVLDDSGDESNLKSQIYSNRQSILCGYDIV